MNALFSKQCVGKSQHRNRPKDLTLTTASEIAGGFQAIEPLSHLCTLAWLQCWSRADGDKGAVCNNCGLSAFLQA